MESLNIKSYFTFTHSAELEHFGKPHPAVYLSVAKKLIVYPEKCLVLEDSVNGIIAGKAAKMKVVCIPEKTHLVDPRIILADFQFDTMSAFLETIR
jgi:sugar-phosphatase